MVVGDGRTGCTQSPGVFPVVVLMPSRYVYAKTDSRCDADDDDDSMIAAMGERWQSDIYFYPHCGR